MLKARIQPLQFVVTIPIARVPQVSGFLRHTESWENETVNRYLAIFIGAASDGQKQEISQDQGRKFMEAWGAWAQKHSGAIVDPGAPLAKTKRVDGTGISSVQNKLTAFMIVQAASHEEAAQIFSDHPHVALLPGNAVEIIECPPLPNG